MPTGYTAAIISNEGISFRDFVLQCARAFGATIRLRDEPISSDIPKIEATNYHVEAIAKTQKELREVSEYTPEQQLSYGQRVKEEEITRHLRYIAENVAKEKKYREMLDQVKAWNPPTTEHVGLKDFMIKQIEESIRFDCDPDSYWEEQIVKIQAKSAQSYYHARLAQLGNDLNYHIQENEKEQTKVAECNKWVDDLRESLK